jgi:hypothetical protein
VLKILAGSNAIGQMSIQKRILKRGDRMISFEMEVYFINGHAVLSLGSIFYIY